jgi:uncharacterized membrane protein
MERREKNFKNPIIIVFIIFLVWISFQFLTPLVLPQNSIQDLSGYVAISDNDTLINRMDFPWNLFYSIGDRLCHQRAERSFFINDNQLPFCSRCTAIWLGLTIGLAFILFYRIRLSEKFLLILIIGITPMALDGIGQLFNFWESTNLTRVITGLIVGIVCGVSIGLIIDEIKDIINNKISTENE